MTVKQLQGPVTWRVFTDDSIEAYVGLEGEPIVDGRSGRKMRVCDGVTPGGNPVGGDSPLGGVATPSIVPMVGGVSENLQPIIQASAFNGLKAGMLADTHAATYWQIATDANFDNLIVDLAESTDHLDFLDLEALGVTLTDGQQLWVRVAYVGTAGVASYWSAAGTFTAKRQIPNTLTDVVHSAPAVAGARFGTSIDLSLNGDVLVVGAASEDFGDPAITGGAAYILNLIDGTWVQDVRLTEATPADHRFYGTAVAISGDGATVAVANNPYSTAVEVDVWRKTNGTWVRAYTVMPDTTAFYEASRIVCLAVSYDGSIVFIGLPTSDTYAPLADAGKVVIIEETAPGVWSTLNEVAPPDPIDDGYFGTVLDISSDGTTLIVGDAEFNAEEGACHVYTRIGDTWTLQQTITLPTASIGHVGGSVSISDDGMQILVSNHQDGQVAHYIWNGTAFVQNAIIDSPSTEQYFGHGVEISPDGSMFVAMDYARTRWVFAQYNGSWALEAELYGTGSGWINHKNALSSDGSTLLFSNEVRNVDGYSQAGFLDYYT